MAQLQRPDGADLPWYLCVFLALLATTAIGAFQGSIVAKIGVPSFVVTLAGFEIWQGVIQERCSGRRRDPGRHDQQRLELLLRHDAGWIMSPIISISYVGGMVGAAISQRRHGIAIRDPVLWVLKLVVVPVIAFVTV